MSCEPRKCEHIKTNGVRCGSPALRDENFCYFHHRARRDFPHRAEPASGSAGLRPQDHRGCRTLPRRGGCATHSPRHSLPRGRRAIQYGLGKVIYGLLNGLIDHRTAGLTLYALQTASGNLKNTSLLKRSQQADEDDRSNVSPLLAYYLGPSREDYSRVLRILQEAEADLKNKTREITDLKQRLGEPCEGEPSEGEPKKGGTFQGQPSQEETTTEPAWVERLHRATATEPREERYPRNLEPARIVHRPASSSPTHRSQDSDLSIDASEDTTARELSPVGAAHISPARKRWVKVTDETEPRRGDTTAKRLEESHCGISVAQPFKSVLIRAAPRRSSPPSLAPATPPLPTQLRPPPAPPTTPSRASPSRVGHQDAL